MNNEALISVIVPVYNVEKFVGRCLNSILNNTYKNLEIICIDDGSTDNSLEVLRAYEAKDSRVHVYSQNNHGIAYTRNAGTRLSTGDYVAYIDSDDWIHRRYFELLMNAMYAADADIAMCNYIKTAA